MFGRRPKHMDPDGGAERDEAIGQSPLAPYFLMMIEPDQVVQLHCHSLNRLSEQVARIRGRMAIACSFCTAR